MSSDLRSVLFMLFNPVKDELITGGVGGIKVYLTRDSYSLLFIFGILVFQSILYINP